MGRISRVVRRFTFLIHRDRFYRELQNEIALHAELKREEHAPNEMGNVTLALEESRETWSFLPIETLFVDAKQAIRMFARTPIFTLVAISSIALGIAGNTAMFSLVDTLLLRPLPYALPERLVRITGVYPRAALPWMREQSRTMDIAAVSNGSELNLTGLGPPARVMTSFVSPEFLSTLRVRTAKGRTFESGEDVKGRDGVAIISASLSKELLGRAISLNGVNRTVVGIMPPAFSYGSTGVQCWLPMRLDRSNFLEYWAGDFVTLVGRLRPGVTVEQARSEISVLVSRFRKTFPYPMARDWNADATAIPLQDDVTGTIKTRLLILLASVALVLLVACGNVANLLLSRASVRRREIALRSALGAGRLRIVRQLLTESTALSIAGAGCGVVLGIATLSVFKSLLPASTPGLAEVQVDWRIVISMSALALITGLIFGLAPALSASQIDLGDAMKTGSGRATAGFWVRFRSVLIATEVGLTLVLVVGAGLLSKSLYELSNIDPGFSSRDVFAVHISPDPAKCDGRASCVALYDRLLASASRLSGIDGAALSNSVPMDGQIPTIPVNVQSHPNSADHPAPMIWLGAVSPRYLELLKVPLLAGRYLSFGDGADSPAVALISDATARHLWPGESALGKQIKPTGSQRWRTVVGIVGDVHQYTLSRALPDWVPGIIYMPYAQSEREDGRIPAAMTLVVRTKRNVGVPIESLRKLVAEQDVNAAAGSIIPLQEVLSGSIADFRATTRVFVAFSVSAMLLAAIGIYGLMSYWVTQRQYEIGLRVAIGAGRARIVAMILGQGLRVSLYGVLGGVFAALLLTRFLRSLLYGVGATDALTFLIVITITLSVASLATAFPALRASRIDPAKSLRAE